jgi:chorismate mutase / prephenate dehydratase
MCRPYPDCARAFRRLTPLYAHDSSAQAMADVSRGRVAVAVLPLPSESDAVSDAWWTRLLPKEGPRLYIVARLPFWAPRPDGAPAAQALVVATTEPDPSGHDCSVLGLELDEDVSHARLTDALASAGLTPGSVILCPARAAPTAHALVEVDGFLTDNDPRLSRLSTVQRLPRVLGAYAVPQTGGAI